MAAPISEISLNVLQSIGIANPPINSMDVNRRITYVHKPRRKVEYLIGKGLVKEENVGFVLTTFGEKLLAEKMKKKSNNLTPPRNFTRKGEYKGLKLTGIREGSLDFLSIPAIVNGKEVEVHPCLKS